ncbi:hypothetical protein GGQ54_001964 [Naumannella cuiyingiana]|uniref:Uncharacterized protein n=1 Tax=Naumannella cuiyingiana TaxID=1347891 RepID=A0A7Z0IL94_9ACTN|nr:hypothetical protein [Naumannella cuiyingiana]NYI71404.1 hypothetical protein [Naumannella cuiyingiana]
MALSDRWSRRRIGIALQAGGVIATVLLAFVSNVPEPPSGFWQAALALSGIACQVGAAFTWNGVGKPSSDLARRAVGRLSRATLRSTALTSTLEELYDDLGKGSQYKGLIGKVSVMASQSEETFLDAIEDWRTFQPELVAELIGPEPIPEGKNTDD